jgi:hypothetical protein
MPPLAGRYALPYSISEARPATQTSEFDRPGKQVLVLGPPSLMGQKRTRRPRWDDSAPYTCRGTVAAMRVYVEPFDWDVSLTCSLPPIAKEYVMNGIIYIVGLVVVVGVLLSFFGLR